MKQKHTIPVEKNEIIELNIDGMGVNGEGIGHYQGYTLFVDGALLGEKVEVKVVKTGKNFGFGKILHFIEVSKDRVEPVCPVANTCGGCQVQHMSYDAQLAYKKNLVASALERIGKIDDVKVNDVLGMDEPYYYRNKVIYPVRLDNGVLKIGFYAKRSHRIVEHDTCYIQDRKNEAIIEVVKEWMLSNGITPYDENNNTGMIRHIMIRYSRALDKCHVTIVSNKKKLKQLERLFERLGNLGTVDGISYSVNIGKDNKILGDEVRSIWGNMELEEHLRTSKYMISPKAFFQVNPVQTEQLYDTVKRMAGLKGDETLMDLYCGLGSITLYLAKQAKHVIGVEVIEEAIENANRNAELNGIDHVDFYVGAAEDVIPHLYETQGLRADVVVVDPPRKGCDETLLKTICEMAPSRMVYVSCDPGTLARDLLYLTENGFEVEEVQPVDMFPMTVHVETVSLLKRSK